MARQRNPRERKLRTREHIIADLGVNYVERQILLRGFSVNRLATDYGIDMLMTTHTERGEVENGHILFQVKATDRLQVLKDGKTLSIRIEISDLKAWQAEFMPVILVIYDGKRDRAYWLYVQQYLDEKQVSIDDFSPDQDRVTIRIPLKQRLRPEAMERFRQYRNYFLEQIGGTQHGS